jgi:hypothetical protein
MCVMPMFLSHLDSGSRRSSGPVCGPSTGVMYMSAAVLSGAFTCFRNVVLVHVPSSWPRVVVLMRCCRGDVACRLLVIIASSAPSQPFLSCLVRCHASLKSHYSQTFGEGPGGASSSGLLSTFATVTA